MYYNILLLQSYLSYLYLCIFSLFFDEGRSDLASVIYRLLKPQVILDVLSLFIYVFRLNVWSKY